MTISNNYRLRICEPSTSGHHYTYFTRIDGKTSYFSASETPLALSNLLQSDAAETRFALQDAKDGMTAQGVLFKALQERWKKNPKACPLVELIS